MLQKNITRDDIKKVKYQEFPQVIHDWIMQNNQGSGSTLLKPFIIEVDDKDNLEFIQLFGRICSTAYQGSGDITFVSDSDNLGRDTICSINVREIHKKGAMIVSPATKYDKCNFPTVGK